MKNINKHNFNLIGFWESHPGFLEGNAQIYEDLEDLLDLLDTADIRKRAMKSKAFDTNDEYFRIDDSVYVVGYTKNELINYLMKHIEDIKNYSKTHRVDLTNYETEEIL